jgi:hypothetical protein
MWSGTQILVVTMTRVHVTVHTLQIGTILHVMVMGFAFRQSRTGPWPCRASGRVDLASRPAGATGLVQGIRMSASDARHHRQRQASDHEMARLGLGFSPLSLQCCEISLDGDLATC